MAAFVVLLAPAAWVLQESSTARESIREEDYCICMQARQATSTSQGSYFFLGGEVSSMDHAIARGQARESNNNRDLLPTVLRIAALREVFTQSGALLATPPPPAILREPTRAILQRDGPRTFLDCMIAWDGGNPSPVLTLCPLETLGVMHTSDDRVLGRRMDFISQFFIAEVPDANELTCIRATTSNMALWWMKPSEIWDLFCNDRIALPIPERSIIESLLRRLPRLHDLSHFLSAYTPLVLERLSRL